MNFGNDSRCKKAIIGKNKELCAIDYFYYQHYDNQGVVAVTNDQFIFYILGMINAKVVRSLARNLVLKAYVNEAKSTKSLLFKDQIVVSVELVETEKKPFSLGALPHCLDKFRYRLR